MNQVLPDTWVERIDRLRLGVQPRDGLGRAWPIGGLGLHLEDVPRPWPLRPGPGGVVPDDIGLPGVPQSPSGRFAVRLTTSDPAGQRLAVRIVDPSRRYVPRRLSVPVPGYAAVLAGDAAHDANPATPLTPRATRPVLLPGAAYGTAAGATIVRGRVRWSDDGSLVRWARVDATTADPITIHHDDGTSTPLAPPLGLAHGDDRGEFLLVVAPLPLEVASASEGTVPLAVTVHAAPRPAPGAPPDTPAVSRADPLWDLPVERVGALGDDPVADGTVLPPTYTKSVTVTVVCRLGTPTRPAVAVVMPA